MSFEIRRKRGRAAFIKEKKEEKEKIWKPDGGPRNILLISNGGVAEASESGEKAIVSQTKKDSERMVNLLPWLELLAGSVRVRPWGSVLLKQTAARSRKRSGERRPLVAASRVAVRRILHKKAPRTKPDLNTLHHLKSRCASDLLLCGKAQMERGPSDSSRVCTCETGRKLGGSTRSSRVVLKDRNHWQTGISFPRRVGPPDNVSRCEETSTSKKRHYQREAGMKSNRERSELEKRLLKGFKEN